ncbi:hypothetical protein HOY82DRAFT_626801 [Tuber indicum]|nr:hypothetical protein HOY82DRAFT_626801 [Tuber indicum]
MGCQHYTGNLHGPIVCNLSNSVAQRHYINNDSHNDTNLAIGQTDSASSSKPPLGQVPQAAWEDFGALNKEVAIAKSILEHFETYQNVTNIELRDLSKKMSSAFEDLSNKIGNDIKDREIKAQALADSRHADLESRVKTIIHQELIEKLGAMTGVFVVLFLMVRTLHPRIMCFDMTSYLNVDYDILLAH